MEKLLLRNRTFTNVAGKTTRKTLTSVYRFAFSALLTLGLFFGSAQSSMAQTPVLSFYPSSNPHPFYVDQTSSNQTYQMAPAQNVSAPSYAAQSIIYHGGNLFSPTAVNVDASGNVYFGDEDGGVGVLDMIPVGQTTPTVIATGLGGNGAGAIAFDVAGNLYYTTTTSVYEITTPGQAGSTTTQLITGFTHAIGLALDAAGNIYVVDDNNAVHSLYKYLASNSFASSTLISSAFNTPTGLALDASGNIYVSDFGTGNIYEIPASITTYPVASSSFITVVTVGAPNSLGIDNAGNLFVASNATKSILRIDPSGNEITVSATLSYPASANVDANGNVYFTDLIAGTVYESKLNGGFYISPALPAGFTFNAVTGAISATPVTAAPASKLYTVTAYNSTSNTSASGILNVEIFDAHLSQLTLSAGTLSPAFTPTGQNYSATVINASSISVTINSPGTIHYGSPVGPTVAKGVPYTVPLSTGQNGLDFDVIPVGSSGPVEYNIVITNLASPTVSYSTPPSYFAGRPITSLTPASTNVSALSYAAAATFYNFSGNSPQALASDANGNIYSADGTEVDKVAAGGGSYTIIQAGFSSIANMSFDAAGNLYISDNSAGTITEITQPGQTGSTSNVIISGLTNPNGIAVNAAGNIFVGTSSDILEYTVTGGVVSTTPITVIATNGAGINGLAFDKAGNLYMAWSNSTNVEELPASITSYPVTSGQLLLKSTNIPNFLKGVFADNGGNIFACGAFTVDRIDPSGNITTITNGNAHAITLDPSGNVYFTDGFYNIDIVNQNGGYYISPALPGGLSLDGSAGTISGTPTAASAATNYTVTGYNTLGAKATGTVSLTVFDTRLANLTTTGTINQTVTSATFAYTGSANVVNFSITPTVSNPTSTITINGTAATSGAASVQTLTVGSNVFNIVVTASDGTTATTYTLTVTGIAAPAVSYAGPQVYSIGNTVSLMPTSSNVSALSYTAVSTFYTFTGLNPSVFASDANGNIFVGNGTEVDEVLAGGGSSTPISSGYGFISNLTFDAAGNLYVADGSASTISKIAQPGHPGSTLQQIIANANDPSSIAVDATGNIFVGSGNTISKYTFTNGVASSPVTVAQVSGNANGLAVDKVGNLYIALSNSTSLVEIPTGITTYPVTSGQLVSIATNIPNYLTGVIADNAGNIFACGYTTIDKIDPSGNVTTISTAQAHNMAIDPSGNIYVGNDGNNVEVINQNGGYYISPALPPGLSLDGSAGTISGTPLATSVATNYTISAYNTTGSKATTTVSLAVVDTHLASLTTTGTLSPTFAPGTLTYTGTGGIVNFSITPTTINPSSTITINGTAATSGIASVQTLVVGTNNFNIIVSNGAASTTYTLTVTGIGPPAISYTSPPVYTAGTAITTLSPTTESNVAAFSYGTQSAYYSGEPSEALATDAAGNLYLAISGSSIVKIPAGGGAPVTLATGFTDAVAIAVDPSGTIYVSDNTTNAIYTIVNPGPSSTNNILISGLNSPYGIAYDASTSSLYVLESNNIASDLKQYKITAGVAGAATIACGNLTSPTGIAVDNLGNVYIADGSFTTLFKIPAGSAYPILAANMTSIGSGLSSPTAVAIDAGGNLYVTEEFNGDVKKIAAGSGAITTISTTSLVDVNAVAVDGSGNIYYNNAQNKITYQLQQVGGYGISPALPAGLTLDFNTGNISGTPTVASPATIYTVTAYGNGQQGTATLSLTVTAPSISYGGSQTFAAGAAITTLTPTGTSAGTLGYSATKNTIATGTATTTTPAIINPTAIATDATGNIFVMNDLLNNSLYSAALVRIPTSTVTYNLGGLVQVANMCIDAAGNIYTADRNFSTILKITPAGVTSTVGTGLVEPDGVAVDAAGNIYVAESVSPGKDVVKIAPNGTKTVIATGFVSPSGIAIDAAGNLYIADYNGNAVYKMAAGTIAPKAASALTKVGTSITNPTSIAVDPSGNLFIASEGNGNALEISNTGIQTTIASGFSTSALWGITPDGAGNIDMTDNINSIVYQVPPTGGYFITPALPAGLSFNNSTGAISGTPATGTPAANYTVTGWIGAGVSVNTTVNIGVTSSISTLSNIVLGSGTLSPAFSSATTTGYTVSVTTPTISITPVATDPSATITINGNPATSGVVSSVPLTLGANTVNIQLTSSDNSTTQTYTLTVNYALSTNANLSNLTISTGTLNPVFATATNNYTVTVPVGTASVNITPTLAEPTATVNISSPSIPTGSASTNFPITTGSNLITVTVTAGDGVTQDIYTVTVNTPATPVISYAGPQVYNAGTAISTLLPTNSHVDAYAYSSNKTVIANNTATSTTPALANPTGIAINNNNVFLVNLTSANTASVYQIPTGTVPAYGSGLEEPFNMVSDGAGNLYLADALSGSIQKINIATNTQTLVASGFSEPAGVAVDAAGNVYVADAALRTITKISNGVKTTYAKSFSAPFGLAFDVAGNLYVADDGGSAIYKIPAGTTTDPSASSLTKITATLNGASAISGPTSIAFDGAGNLYVANDGNGTVIEISNTGVTTLLASGFTELFGVAVDGKGNVYMTDDGGQTAYQVSPVGGYFISPALPLGLTFNNSNGAISGTPLLGSPATNYTITAYNIVGQNASTTLNIQTVSSNASLTSLTLGTGTLSPAFAPATLTGYTATETASSVTLTPTAADPSSTILINGQAVASGMTYNLALAIGGNPVTIAVTASDGVTTQSYSLNITRTVGLSALTLSTGTLSPAFSGGTTSYTASVAVSSITLTPTGADPSYTITVGSAGTPVSSGVASSPIALTPGLNSIPVKVTAADGVTSTTYTIGVTYTPSTVSTLSKLLVNTTNESLPHSGTAFTALAVTTNKITFTPTTSDATATVAIGVGSSPTSFVPVTSGSASSAYTLASGANPFVIKVTAASGSSTSYTLTVNYTPSATLSALTVSSGSLSFNANTTTYSVTSNSPSFFITPTASDAGATLSVSGTTIASGPITSGTATTPITLALGVQQNIIVLVTPVSGATKTYTVNVTYSLSTTSSLSALSVASPSSISRFRSTTFTYSATTVANNVTSISITPTVTDPTSVITIANTTTGSTPVTVTSGSALSVPINAGNNSIAVLVTAQDGVHTTTYTINVTRTGSAISTLSAIGLDNGTLNPVFNTATLGYTVSLPTGTQTLTITPTPTDPQANIAINAINLTTGSPLTVPVNPGINNYNIVVTSPDGSTTTSYNLAVTVPNNALDRLGLTSSTVAAGGYSLRLLSSTYTGPLARITIGSNYYDVYPDASSHKIFSVNSPISAAYTTYNAAQTGATSNLLSSIIAGNTATVDIWYDQSGSSDDAIQSTTSLQPEIINAGVIDLTNALPTVNFQGNNYLVITSIAFNTDLSSSVVYNATSSNNVTGGANTWYTMNGIFGSEQPGGVNDFGYGIYNNDFSAGNGPNDNSIGSGTAVNDGTTRISSWTRTNSSGAIALYNSGTADGSAILNSGVRNSVPSVAIGSITTSGGGNFFGTISELTVFPIVYTDSQRQTVEGNQAAYYDVSYTSTTTVNAITANKPTNTNAASVNYTVTFANAITGLTASNFTVTAPSLSGTSVGTPATADGGITWTVPVNTGTGDGTLVLNLDNATNLSALLTNTLPLAGGIDTIDRTAPQSTGISFLSNNTNHTIADVGNTVTLTFSANEALQTPAVTIAGHAVTATSTGGNGYKASYTMTSGDTPGRIPFTLTMTDLAGNSSSFNDIGVDDDIEFISPDATLSNLSINANPLSPSFDSGTTAYTSSVPAGRVSVSLTPVVNTTGATVTVNNVAAASGSASVPVILNGTGTTTEVDVTVTAPDGITTKTYVVEVTSPAAISADLTSIKLNPYETLKTVSSTATETDYTTTVSPTIGSVTVTPRASTLGQTITVDGNPVASETASQPITLNTNGTPTIITTVVTAQDGTTTKTLVISVSQAPSSVASLSSIQLTPSSTLATVSSTATETDYSTTAAIGTTSVTVTPKASGPGQTITVNGNSVVTGTASAPITLNTDFSPTVITTVVTAPDGTTTNTYVITVNQVPLNVASLTSIVLSPHSTLKVTSTSATETDYTTTAAAGTTSVTVTPKASGVNQTITVDGNPVTSGTASGSITLNTAGTPTVITTVVTAPDGVTTNTYVIAVSLPPSNVASLTSIVLNPYSTLKVTSTTATETDYTTTTPVGTTSVTVTPKASGVGQTIAVDGNPVVSGTASGSIALNADGTPTIITTVVTALDGVTTNTYVITVNQVPSNVASLTSIVLSPYSSLKAISTTATETDYTTTTPAGTTSVTVTPKASGPGQTISVDGAPVVSGTASGSIALNSDGSPTIITTIVTAPDGTTTNTYVVTVSQVPPHVASLTSIVLTPHSTLKVASATATETDYTTTAAAGTTSVTVTPKTSTDGQSITVDGTPVASGTASGSIALNSDGSPTIITTVVTAIDGTTTNTYVITINQVPSVPIDEVNSIAPGAPVSDVAVNDGIVVHQALSPNGDGINDVLTIDGLQKYSDNKLAIMNSNGVLVFSAQNYDNVNHVFDGHSSKGVMQAPGTYFYVLQYKDGNATKTKTGFIVLKY